MKKIKSFQLLTLVCEVKRWPTVLKDKNSPVMGWGGVKCPKCVKISKMCQYVKQFDYEQGEKKKTWYDETQT